MRLLIAIRTYLDRSRVKIQKSNKKSTFFLSFCVALSRTVTGLTDPVAQYGHNLGCSVTGGYVYRGAEIAALKGVYLFSDFCSGRVWGLLQPEEDSLSTVELLKTAIQALSFGESNDGSLFILDLSGTIYHIVAAL